jgi:hypothetical protein
MLEAGGMILREGRLERTPPIFHSTYCNEVRGFRAEDGIRVRGREPAGSCSGLLDTLTGGALPKVADTVPGIRIHAGRRRAARVPGQQPTTNGVLAEPSRCSVLAGCASVPVCGTATPRLEAGGHLDAVVISAAMAGAVTGLAGWGEAVPL